MPRLQRRGFAKPDAVREFPHGRVDVVNLDETAIGRIVSQPGWRWSTDVAPIVHTPWCQNRHVGYAISGHLHVVMDDGTEMDIVTDDAYEIPPGHDAWVVGDETWDTVEFTSARSFGVAPDAEDERTLATILFTDIVDSTATLGRLGDKRWRVLLLDHNDRLRAALDRFRGREVVTTGDLFLAQFNSAARAVRCAAAMTESVRPLGIEIRAGLHTGEIALVGGNARGSRPYRGQDRRARWTGRGLRLRHDARPARRVGPQVPRRWPARTQGDRGRPTGLPSNAIEWLADPGRWRTPVSLRDSLRASERFR